MTVLPNAPKKIILSFDGTMGTPLLGVPIPDEGYNPSNDINKAANNILKLHLLAGGSFDEKTNAVPGQICLYATGVGVNANNSFVYSQNLYTGILREQTAPMLKKLEAVYEKGDELFIIGFSRGAAAARQFVSDMDAKGLKTASGGHEPKPRVVMLGCFDTVSMQVWKNIFIILRTALEGDIMTSSVVGEDGGKPPSIVETAVHNLSLDDDRFRSIQPRPFSPIFMDSKDPRVHETWFAGGHSDVGGNFYKNGVSDISGNYMMEWLALKGVTFIDPTSVTEEARTIPGHPDVAPLAPPNISILPRPGDEANVKQFMDERKSLRPVVAAHNDEIIKGATVRVHRSVLDHLKLMKNTKTPYLYNGRLKDADFKVIGTFDNVLEKETKELKDLLPLSECRQWEDGQDKCTEEEAQKVKAMVDAQEEEQP